MAERSIASVAVMASDGSRDSDDDARAAETLVNQLQSDRFFREWGDVSKVPTPSDLLEAGYAALGNGLPSPVQELERDRQLRKLILLQIVAPYFEGDADTWETVFWRLSDHDRAQVEAVLGNDSLADILDTSPLLPPGPEPQH